DHVVDRGGVLPDRAQRLGRVATLDAFDVAILLAHPHTGAGLHQETVPVGLDEQESEAAEDAAALVGGHEPAPQRFRHDAEGAAGIGPEPAGADNADGDPAGEPLRRGDLMECRAGLGGHPRTTRPRSKSAWYRLAVGSVCPRYFDPMRASPYPISTGELRRWKLTWPIFMPSYSWIGRFATFDSSRVR